MKDPTIPIPLQGATPCDSCLEHFIRHRHAQREQIDSLMREVAMFKAVNQTLRARNADLVENEIRLRLDRQDSKSCRINVEPAFPVPGSAAT